MSDMEYYNVLKRNGICTRCKYRKAEHNKTRCAKCAKSLTKSNKAYYEKNKEFKKAYQYELRNQRKALGVCVLCGNPKLYDNTQLCMEHCLKRRRRDKNRPKINITRSERPAYGLCYICEKPVMQNKKLCPACYTHSINALNKASANRKNHSWREQNKLIFKKKVEIN